MSSIDKVLSIPINRQQHRERLLIFGPRTWAEKSLRINYGLINGLDGLRHVDLLSQDLVVCPCVCGFKLIILL